MLLIEWLETWIDLYKTEIRENTRRMYTVALHGIQREKVYQNITMETVQLRDLLSIRQAQLTRARTAPRAAQIERAMIVQAIRKAQALGITDRNIDVREALPNIQHKAQETAVFTEAQLMRYVAAVMDSGDPCTIPLLLCCCGLRRGEALGVRWVDWANPIISINGALSRGVYGPPKSRMGIRSLIVPRGLAVLIEQQPRTLRSPYIVQASEKQLQSAHRRIMDDAGLEGVTLHGLRHTFATMAASKGVSMKLLQTALGHSKISLTADLYAGHRLPPSVVPAQVLQDVI